MTKTKVTISALGGMRGYQLDHLDYVNLLSSLEISSLSLYSIRTVCWYATDHNECHTSLVIPYPKAVVDATDDIS